MHLSGILLAELAALRARRGTDALHIVETGTIRNVGEQYRINDGWSTLTFAQHVAEHGGRLVAIDLDTSAAEQVLTGAGLLTSRVNLVQRDSRDELRGMAQHPDIITFDVAFLDSDNDPELIFDEFRLVGPMMTSPGLIMVDDVDMDSTGVVKGHKLVPHLDEAGIPYRIVKRHGDGYTTGVLIIEV